MSDTFLQVTSFDPLIVSEPQGPQGPQGQAGPAGASGPQGLPGGGRPVSLDGTNGLPLPTGVGLEFVIGADGLDDIRHNGVSL
jgi:hypothetical protein